MLNTYSNDKTIIIGGGLTGLAAGCVLSRAGRAVRVFERDAVVGGISRTVQKDGFRFDLGGHRFFTHDASINAFVQELMGDELVEVGRSSKIYLNGKFFDYPLKPMNALSGLGLGTTARTIADYGVERLRGLLSSKQPVSLEDWVVSNFGRTMFDIYFKEYSEKVWGIDCSKISAEWVEQRIRGLSLAKAIKNAFFKFSGRNLATLADRFLYPALGIGRMSERLKEEIEALGEVSTNTAVDRVLHDGSRILSVSVKSLQADNVVPGSEFVSSMPLPRLVQLMDPLPPREVLDAADSLSFRDLIIVTVMVDRERVTDQSWIYIPQKSIPFGRIHEPTNWSSKMAPAGKTLLVTEFFSSRGDALWRETDAGLSGMAVDYLGRLGFIRNSDVIDTCVVRATNAYPLFEVGYEKACRVIYDYLARFENLHVAGRIGLFKYYNMDHAIRSGIEAADRIMGRKETFSPSPAEEADLLLAGSRR